MENRPGCHQSICFLICVKAKAYLRSRLPEAPAVITSRCLQPNYIGEKHLAIPNIYPDAPSTELTPNNGRNKCNFPRNGNRLVMEMRD